MKLNVKNKIALVSGANRGIGKATTIELLESGVTKVYAGARNISSLNELVTLYGDRVVPIQLDVTNKESINLAVKNIEKLDILINNAGIMALGGMFDDLENSSLEQNLNVNVYGVINLTNAVIHLLKESSNGAIVNISSLAGLGNMPMIGTYSVTKAAVHSITQGMRAELSDSNILVAGVYPGPIDTDMTSDIEMNKDTPKNVAQNILKGLLNGTEDIFPDQMSSQVGEFYATNPKGIEEQFANFA